MSALELVHQMALQGRLQPFIITANRDEAESAAELLKLGAKDLMLKDETFLRRLPVVVAATVKTLYNEIVLKELENALRFNFQKYQGLYETIFDGVGIFVPTEDGRDFICKDFNGAGARILNREREDYVREKSMGHIRQNTQRRAFQRLSQRHGKRGARNHSPERIRDKAAKTLAVV
jgi:PAS domain-containing protein